ncbi:MAG: alpha/beta hydrolase [Chloroflexi bacterium]|nr:alpha/beta hydrolase [Chloroflexota bacterium]
MSNTKQTKSDTFTVPSTTNYVTQGNGAPVIMVHGLAASLHDWDFLLPELAQAGYAGYALDLLGHGDSPKPDSRSYQMDWLSAHFEKWLDSLNLTQPAILIGHSLGGYLVLEYVRRFSARTRGLILVDPFYALSQLPHALRLMYRHPILSGLVAGRTPEWLFRIIVDFTSMSMGHSSGALHALPEEIRAQTALDYTRTAAGVYNLPNTGLDFTPYLPSISVPTLVVWGEQDQTLEASSFSNLVAAMPNARGKHAPSGHVPHQSNSAWFNKQALDFLKTL